MEHTHGVTICVIPRRQCITHLPNTCMEDQCHKIKYKLALCFRFYLVGRGKGGEMKSERIENEFFINQKKKKSLFRINRENLDFDRLRKILH